ncbi:MAG: GNAT family N-acetyltransferase [Candidatus Marinimicrobia bacterium]|nr:GNAT family N-acetyltransferase [Candidatus Neomarinimicrobiota bacterium]
MLKSTSDIFNTNLTNTRSRTLASSPKGIKVEIIEFLGENEYKDVIQISSALVEEYGQKAKFNKKTIKKYFNYPHTLPFVLRHQNKIKGFIIGVPLENFSEESWAQCDINLQKGNTIYTYAYIISEKLQGLGYAKILKRVYQSTIKRKGFKYISGHVRKGVAKNFTKEVQVVKKFKNWNNTGHTFEYYRTKL